jgi:hypothetical protein
MYSLYVNSYIPALSGLEYMYTGPAQLFLNGVQKGLKLGLNNELPQLVELVTMLNSSSIMSVGLCCPHVRNC